MAASSMASSPEGLVWTSAGRLSSRGRWSPSSSLGSAGAELVKAATPRLWLGGELAEAELPEKEAERARLLAGFGHRVVDHEHGVVALEAGITDARPLLDLAGEQPVQLLEAVRDAARLDEQHPPGGVELAGLEDGSPQGRAALAEVHLRGEGSGGFPRLGARERVIVIRRAVIRPLVILQGHVIIRLGVVVILGSHRHHPLSDTRR
jgi:hypothetical protein